MLASVYLQGDYGFATTWDAAAFVFKRQENHPQGRIGA
jgi:hypothetical protein